MRDKFPASAKVFDEMAEEEVRHRTMLFDLYQRKFGDYLPLIRRQDVKGFIKQQAALADASARGSRRCANSPRQMEFEAERFYRKAAETARDASIRKLLIEPGGDRSRAREPRSQARRASPAPPIARAKEDETARRMFVLQYVQPGLVGLMDGSVSTLAPLFAAAFATHSTWETFLVGMAASVGAGISMGFAEALSDDGSLTGRGTPWMRGTVCGMMTTIGGVGHTLPYLIPDFWTATMVAVAVVAVELVAISYIRHRYMDTPFLVCCVSGHGRRRTGVSRGDTHRQFVNVDLMFSGASVGPASRRRCPRPRLARTRSASARLGYLNWRRKRGRIHRSRRCCSASSRTSRRRAMTTSR